MTCDALGRGCRLCKLLSRTVGRTLFWILGVQWPKLEATQVYPHLEGLELDLVGGLKTRGWTTHDVDVVGSAAAAVELTERLRKAGIRNPVHHCSNAGGHSHFACIRGGLSALFADEQVKRRARGH